MTVLLSGTLFAQELPRPSLARHSDNSHTLPTDYNIKLGPVLLNFNSSVEGEYNDNVGVSSTNQVSDFLLTPQIGMDASWPVSQLNTLTLTTSLGYTFYLFHPQYNTSQVIVSPNSRLSFDIYIEDFKINLHDDFSYQQDPISQSVLTNIVNFDRFTNDAGIGVTWDLNKIILGLNYDHLNFFAFDLQNINGSHASNPGALNYMADQISATAESHFSSTFIPGLEATASVRSYDDFSGGYDSYSVGPYLRVQVTDHIKAQFSAGFRESSTPTNNLSANQILQANTLQANTGGSTADSYYADLSLDQQVNTNYFHRLTVGHDLELDVLGNQSEVTSATYTSSWHVNNHVNLAFNLGYQNVEEQGGGLLNASSYNLFNFGAQASFPVTKKMSGSLFYQFNDKIADSSSQAYQSNVLGLILTYHF